MKKKKYYKNVEPKFKVGDWITDGEAIFHVTSYDIDYGYQLETQKGTSFHFSDEKVENKYHLWTIQDAKDGDVLIDKSGSRECPFIFKETKPSDIKTDVLNPLTILGYCGIGGAGFTKSSGWGDTANCIYYPATKKQRDDLFKVMDYEKTKIL